MQSPIIQVFDIKEGSMPKKHTCSLQMPPVQNFTAEEGLRIFWTKFNGFADGMFSVYLGNVREENVPAMRLRVRPIRRAARDSTIIRRFGGKKRVVTPLAHVFSFLARAEKYKPYHFYVYDKRHELRSVHLEYPLEDMDGESGLPTGEQWELRAYPLDFMDMEIDGYVVCPKRLFGF